MSPSRESDGEAALPPVSPPLNDEGRNAGSDTADAGKFTGEEADEPMLRFGSDLQELVSFDGNEPQSDKEVAEELSAMMDIGITITVQLGRCKMDIRDVLTLTRGSVISLDSLAGDSLDILVNDALIARGEVVVVGDKYGIRLTDILTAQERIKRARR